MDLDRHLIPRHKTVLLKLDVGQRRKLIFVILAMELAFDLARFLPGELATWLFWSFDFTLWVVWPTALMVFLAKSAAIRPRDYGLAWPPGPPGQIFVRSFTVFITLSLAANGARNYAGRFFEAPTNPYDLSESIPEGAAAPFFSAYAATTAGLVESILYIGLPWLLYRNFSVRPSRLMFCMFWVIVSVIFALGHWGRGPAATLGAGVFNLVACFWFFRFNSLWPIAIAHLLMNLLPFP